MKAQLSVWGLQMELAWEDAAANTAAVDAWMADRPAGADVLVLPEMWATGFTMRPTSFGDRGDALAAMQRWAAAADALVCGSLSVVAPDGACYNRHYAVEPSGAWTAYDKRHTFSFAGEDAHYAAGTERVVVSWRGWNLLLQTCYDARFPVFSRNRADAPYDGMIYVANWPAVRVDAWATLIRARAIENQSYLIGVNRLGADGNGIAHSGRSAVVDPYGVAREAEGAGWLGGTWDAAALAAFRAKFPVLADGDDFDLKLG